MRGGGGVGGGGGGHEVDGRDIDFVFEAVILI